MSKIDMYDMNLDFLRSFDDKQEIYKLGFRKDGLNRCLSGEKMSHKDHIFMWSSLPKAAKLEKLDNIKKSKDLRYCKYCDSYHDLPTNIEGTSHWRLSIDNNSALKLINPKTDKLAHYRLLCRKRISDKDKINRRAKGLKKWPRIRQIDLTGKIIRTLDRAKDFRQYGFHLGRVSSACNGNSKTHNGYYFKRETDETLPQFLKDLKKEQPDYCKHCEGTVTTPIPRESDEHWKWVPNSSYKEYTTPGGLGVRGMHRCKMESRAYVNRVRAIRREELNDAQKDILIKINKYISEGKTKYEETLADVGILTDYQDFIDIEEDLQSIVVGNWKITKNVLKQVNFIFHVYCTNIETEESAWYKLNDFLINRLDVYKIKYEEHEPIERKIFRGNYSWYFINKDNLRQRCDSSYEAIYASYLTHTNIKFDFHNFTFKSKSGKQYTPDFYLIDSDTYIELKGLPNSVNPSNIQNELMEEFKLNHKFRLLFEQDIIKECGLTIKNIQSIKFRAESKGWTWEDYIIEMFERGEQ